MRTGRFFSTMILASSLSMARVFLAALILDAVSFGSYAVVIAAGAFAGVLLSCGLIEQTYKEYPRLWNDARASEVIRHSTTSTRTLVVRSVLLLVVLLVGALLSTRMDVAVAVGIAGVGLSMAISSLYASVLRATTNVVSLGSVTLLRAVLSAALALIGAVTWGWMGAVFGEMLAGLAAAIFSRRAANEMARHPAASSGAAPAVLMANFQAGGLWIFFGFLAAAAPTYLDRPFIASRFGSVAAASYALLIVFVTAANVFISIVAQKVGPVLVQMERQGQSLAAQARYASRWVAGFWLLWLGGMLLVGLLLAWAPLDAIARKYQITTSLWVAVAALGCLQISVILDFILLSRDVERFVFMAAFGYLAAALVACLVGYFSAISLSTMTWLLSAAKAVHVGCQLLFISRIPASGRSAQVQPA